MMKNKISIWLATFLATAALTTSACELAPTKSYTKESRDSRPDQALESPIRITEQTILLDARAPFEYAVAHLPGSFNVSWRDFSDRSGRWVGHLKKDLYSEARRLAAIGIDPKTPVVIVGSGLRGNGEEGRLAWTLQYLGVENVQIADIDSLGLRYSNTNPPPRESRPTWQPNYRKNLQADREELLKVATQKFDDRAHIIDVRSEKEYFSRDKEQNYAVPDLRALNIDWKQFLTKDGRPRLALREELKRVNVLPTDRVLVISNNGLRSGLAAHALMALGYRNVANVSGGYAELLKKSQLDDEVKDR